MSWFTYLLECNDGSLYCGYTNDLEKRLQLHNSGKGAKYTRGRLPVKLVTSRECASKHEAMNLEYKVKKQSKSKKVSFLRSFPLNKSHHT